MKIDKLHIFFIFALLISAWVYLHTTRKLKEERDNAKDIIHNYINDSVSYEINKDSTISAYVNTITVLKSNLSSLLGENTNLKEKVKLNNLQSLQSIKFVTKDSFIIKLKDSIRHIDSLHIETIKFFDYTDNYINQHCEIDSNGEVICNYEYNDSVIVIVSLIKTHKWYQFWKWFSKKKSVTEVIFANPKSKAIKIQSIIIEKQ